MADAPDLVPVGRVTGAYGVQGWVRVSSDTEPAEGILDYSPWWVGSAGRWREIVPIEGRFARRGVVVARLEGCADREAALALVGADVAVPRERFPTLEPGEFYWADLVGLEVRTREGEVLGRVAKLMETGANDVLVVRGEREHLVPYLPDRVVLEVDPALGRILVDWDPEF